MTFTSPYEGPRHTIVHIVRGNAERRPDSIAITFLEDGERVGQQLTYRELDRRARALAGRLQALKIEGERALLLFESDVNFIVAFLGCLYARVTAIPAYPPRSSHHLKRLQALVADAQATVVLAAPSIVRHLGEQATKLPVLASAQWVVLGEADDALADAWRMPDLGVDTLAFLQYTSGSTGTPKGVMVSHGNLVHNESMIEAAFGHSDKTLVVGWLPLFHDMGLIGNVLQPLYLGVSCVLMSPMAFLQKPVRWLRAISEHGATTSGAPDFAYDLCVRRIPSDQLEGIDLSGWKLAYNGSEPVRADVLDAFVDRFTPYGFRRTSFYPCYGMAEATLFISGGDHTAAPIFRTVDAAMLEQGRQEAATGDQPSRRLVSCGQVWHGQEVRIVDPSTSIPCPPGQVGEIWLSGESVAQGYWNRPELTREVFQARLPDSGERTFLRTGDLGFVDSSQIYVTGRLKDLIIVRGRNHYPQDIERTVEQSSPVLRPGGGAAFSVEGPEGEALVVVQEVAREHLRKLDAASVIGQIRQAISEEHELMVHAVVLLKTSSLPKTSSGKTQRSACRTGFLAGTLDAVGQWVAPLVEPVPEPAPPAPASGPLTKDMIQDWLVERVAARLRLPVKDIDPKEPMAHFGLDSSVAVSLTEELGQWLGVKLDPTLFWEYPSIEHISSHLATISQ